MPFPPAGRDDATETLHGHRVADPYRWLEDATSAETAQWAGAQDALVRSVLDAIPGRETLRARLRELMPGDVHLPTVAGGRTFFLRRESDQEHAVYIVRGEEGDERVLIDPVAIDPTLATTLDIALPSWAGDRVVYVLSEGGREDGVLRVLDTATGEIIDGPILLGRGPDMAWLTSDELVYVGRLPDDRRPAGDDQFHRRVWRHRIGDPQSTDEMLFGAGIDKTAYYGVNTSPDGRWLTVTVSLGTAPRNDLFICDLSGDARFVAVQEGVDAQAYGWVAHDERLYVVTDRDAPRWRACVASPSEPQRWTDLISEGDTVLSGFTVTDDAVVVVRAHDIISRVTVHDRLTGAWQADVALPGLGSAAVSSRRAGGNDVWISYTDHVTPSRILHYDVGRHALTPWADPPGAAIVGGIRTEQRFFASKDGARIPMFLIRRHDVEPNGGRPTILYGYGGFNISLSPAYASSILAWVERGGVYAIANLRGGGEYGEEWHRAGMRAEKQNVFDDFIAAAEWLIGEGWTDSQHLGISGGSNGGLLVGAALTQRPDLVRAAVCSAPLLDMVRYERFGLGQTWNDEYGRADNPVEFEWLLSYSPYHRVEPDTRYPAVLFTVFEGDTRVDPLHARKLAAALQHATTVPVEDRPILLRRESDVGHAGRAVTLTIGLQVDSLSFLADQLGLGLGS